jgi:hypothetical protein
MKFGAWNPEMEVVQLKTKDFSIPFEAKLLYSV